MKKNYMSPAQRIVELDTTELIAESESLTLFSAPEDEITSSDEILVKESSRKNLWDDSEW